MNVGSLCSGYGGLDLAVGGTTRWVADVDRDASTVLAHRFPDAPNLGDLNAVDWSTVEPVDVLTAGYPCQPFSTAGRRQGEDDDRHIWPGVLRAIRSLRPRLVVLENVAGHLSLGFGRVLGDLAEAGFDAEWCLLRASDVGAPHRRSRVFVVAHPHGQPAGRFSGTDARAEGAHGGRAEGDGDRPSDGRGTAADADSQGREGQHRPPEPSGGAGPLPDSQPNWGCYGSAIKRWGRTLGRPAPAPMSGKQLNARFVEWMMGLPDGWVTDLIPNRRALHTLGNGVVPQQAAAAIKELTA